ncbi:MAG: hypothetical protein D6729_10965 [Deltaproteobacteria bacterium]|nr:MAG: hypothetical protein D6729_10965 [Deltaproteobacteria bacterium]
MVARAGWGALLDGGGVVWYGGAIGGATAFALYCRVYRLPLPSALDLAAPMAALGQAFGRVGCFLAGCCHGAPCAPGALAVVYPPGRLAPPGVPLYAVQLYEASGLLVLALALSLAVWRGRRWPRGAVAWLWLLAYPCLRFVLEFFRGDDRGGHFGPFSPSQAISLVLFAAALAIAVAWHRRRLVAAPPANRPAEAAARPGHGVDSTGANVA